MKRILLCLIFSVLLNQIRAQTFTERVKTKADTLQVYAMYQPKETATKSPVIFLFDPLGRAKLAVENFRPVADQFGFTIFASYNVKNGPLGISLNAANAMIQDAFSRFSIDPNQLFLAGFSGGARLATEIADRAEVKGVFAAGAGFNQTPSARPR